jgi:ceramide glucosyltransferase
LDLTFLFSLSPAAVTAWLCLALTTLHLVSVAIAGWRCSRAKPAGSLKGTPPITLVRPLRGLDNFAVTTLETSFALDYPNYEILFCVADAQDPIVPLVEAMIKAHPDRHARLLIGDDKISTNPKLNNCAKGWAAARHEWIVMADCNVLLPADFLQRLLVRWHADTGLVCSTPIGARPEGFGAELECAFLNTFQAKWQYVSEAIGLGFAQGKTMLWRRDILEAAGGIRALGAEIAEDAAATKVVRRAGLHVQLVDRSFEQPLGRRRFAEVWARQVRWARLRRATFPAFFIPEAIAGSAIAMIAGAYAAFSIGVSVILTLAALAVIWFGAEAWLARVAGWHFRLTTLLAMPLRDLLLPILWIDAWLADEFVWRGNEMSVGEPTDHSLEGKA